MMQTPIKILLIEDDEDDYLLTRDLLRKALGERHELDWIADFERAVAMIAEVRHDVYLVDYRLGSHSGLDVMHRARTDGCAAPFIMLSGQGNEELAVDAMKGGFEDYVVKGSLTVDGLARAVGNAIEKVALRQEIKRKQQALNEALEQQLRLKDEFLSQVAHELRTPLSVIHQFLSIMLDGIAGEISEQQREYLTIAFTNAEQLKKLIADLIEGARAQTGKLRVDTQPVTLKDLLAETVTALRSAAGAKAVTLRGEVAEPLPQVLADGARVRQVLNNLIENAIKFTPGGGRIVVSARLCADKPGFVQVSVADTGRGISSEGLSRVFGRLYQEHAVSAESRQGLGLGLYICKELIEGHHGEIWAESVPGQGSTFHFTLPVVAPAHNAERAYG